MYVFKYYNLLDVREFSYKHFTVVLDRKVGGVKPMDGSESNAVTFLLVNIYQTTLLSTANRVMR